MRAKMSVLAAIIAIVAVLGCQQAEKPPEKPKVTIPKGHVIVRENILIEFLDRPEVHMRAARDALQKKNSGAAARELRLASAFMKLQLARAQGPSKKVLKASITEMDNVASSLEQGTALSRDDLNLAFARAQYALALHHYEKAAREITTDAKQKAARDLGAAAAHAENALVWSGRKATADEKAVVAAGRDLAKKIIEGAAWEIEAAERDLAALRAHIQKIGTAVGTEKESEDKPSQGKG